MSVAAIKMTDPNQINAGAASSSLMPSVSSARAPDASTATVAVATGGPSANSSIKGIAFVVLGASSYGMLSTFVKLAYLQGYTTAEVTVSQFAWGALVLSLMSLMEDREKPRATQWNLLTLMAAGLTLGLTSILYYAAVQFIAASVAVVLLMQSVWMGVVIESIQVRKFPSVSKLAAVVLILIGTLLATNLIGREHVTLDLRGVILGLLAALSFSITMLSSNSIATHLSSIKRSQFMLYGGCIVVLIFAFITQSRAFDFSIFYKHGLFVAIFGTIIPPVLMNRGFPIVGVGLGSILSSVELPFAVIVSSALLGEKVGLMQWCGVITILSAVVMLNHRLIRPVRPPAPSS